MEERKQGRKEERKESTYVKKIACRTRFQIHINLFSWLLQIRLVSVILPVNCGRIVHILPVWSRTGRIDNNSIRSSTGKIDNIFPVQRKRTVARNSSVGSKKSWSRMSWRKRSWTRRWRGKISVPGYNNQLAHNFRTIMEYITHKNGFSIL